MQIYAASHLVPASSPPVAGGALAVEGGRIVAVGTLAEIRATHGGPVHEFPGCAIVPGLVNAHTHLELTHFPSWKIRKDIDYSPRTYVDWVIQVIKIRRALGHEELEASVREGIAKSLEAGTTTVGEILTDRSLLPLYRESPLCGRLFFEAIGQDPVQCGALQEEIESALAAFAGGGFLPGLSPHAPHTVAPQLLRELAAMAGRRALPLMIHLAESPQEREFLHSSGGGIAELIYPMAGWQAYLPPPRRSTPTAYLDQLGVLEPNVAAVHCVQVTPADAEILRERGVTVVLCPRSNDRLAVGRAPLHLFLKKGIPLALGTDSLASNDSLSLWDEMRFLRREFPGLFTPAEVLAMATTGAARALGMGDAVGSLAPGMRGDFLVVRPAVHSAPQELIEGLIEEGEVARVYSGGERL